MLQPLDLSDKILYTLVGQTPKGGESPLNQDHKITFRCDSSLYAQLLAICKKQGVKPSVIIRDALTIYCIKNRPK